MSGPSTSPTGSSENKGPGIVAGTITVGALAGCAVCLRVLSRRGKRVRLGADDYLIVAALVSLSVERVREMVIRLMKDRIRRHTQPLGIAMSTVTVLAVHHGVGKHNDTVPEGSIPPMLKFMYIAEILWSLALPLIKFSILILYLRVFGSLPYIRYSSYTIGAITTSWLLAMVVGTALQCRPIQAIWDRTIEGAQCIYAPTLFLAGSAMNVFTDFVVLLLPVPAVWGLQTGWGQKCLLMGIFALGSFTSVISLAGLVNLVQIADNLYADPAWSMGFMAVWSTTELNLGIVCSCLPTMKPVIHMLSNLFHARPLTYAVASHSQTLDDDFTRHHLHPRGYRSSEARGSGGGVGGSGGGGRHYRLSSRRRSGRHGDGGKSWRKLIGRLVLNLRSLGSMTRGEVRGTTTQASAVGGAATAGTSTFYPHSTQHLHSVYPDPDPDHEPGVLERRTHHFESFATKLPATETRRDLGFSTTTTTSARAKADARAAFEEDDDDGDGLVAMDRGDGSDRGRRPSAVGVRLVGQTVLGVAGQVDAGGLQGRGGAERRGTHEEIYALTTIDVERS